MGFHGKRSQDRAESFSQGILFILGANQEKVNSVDPFYLSIPRALQSNRKIEEMSLQKKPALRRHFSQDKLTKPKDCSLPTLIKPHGIHHLPKRYNLEPFKLRVNHAEERKPDTHAPVVVTAVTAPAVEIRPQVPQKEEILERVESPLNSSQKSEHQVPINNTLNFQNILQAFQRQPLRKPLKRRTMAYGESASMGDQSLNESSNQSITFDDEGQTRGRFKRISRKFSLSTIPTANGTELRQVGVVEKRSNFCNKQSKKQIQRVLFYHDFLRQQAGLHDLVLTPVKSYEDQTIQYCIGSGNNRRLIKQCMERRWWWKEANKRKGEFVNFSWTQLKDQAFIIRNQPHSAQLSTNESQEDEAHQELEVQQDPSNRTLHNHFESNKYLGSKLSVYLSLKQFCLRKNRVLSQIMLPTFYVCRFMDDDWKLFTKAYFQRLEISRIDNWDVNINKKYWMVKQIDGETSNNKVFTTYKEIKQHIEKQCKKGSRFLIQKYISKPFLFKRRKFDIRTYALVVRLKHKINVYLHQEGVISTATENFDMNDIDNPLAHITTEAVQIRSKNFGEYEPGNKVDFHAFQEYLDSAFGGKYNFAQQAFPLIKQAVSLFVQANCARLRHSKLGSSFELVQCEFSMDDDFKPWLIDVHTNPSLDTYCQVLEKVLPGVIEDTFKHTVDVLFPPPLEWPENKHHLMVTKSREDGFVLIFQEAVSSEREGQEGLQGVESQREIYDDDLLMDSQGVQCEQRLLSMDYLLNQAMNMG